MRAVLFALLLLTLPLAAKPKPQPKPKATPVPQPVATPAPAPARTPFDPSRALIMEPVVVYDPELGNREALRFLKPAGWSAQGGVRWYPNLSNLVCLELRVNEPGGLRQIETFPWAHFTWSQGQTPGTIYFGDVVRPPITEPAQVVQQITIPQLRPGATIVGYQDFPALAQALSQNNEGGDPVRAGRVRINYTVNGQPVEEDIYLSIYFHKYTSTPGCRWGPSSTPFGLRAARGQLDEATPLMLAAVNSARDNPQWFAGYAHVKELFNKRMWQSIRNTAAISDTITRNSNAISQMYSDAYWQRQASQDRVYSSYSDSIRGVTSYQSPAERYPVQLPSGYRNVYLNDKGMYILTNDEGDPGWTRLAPTR